MQVPDKIANAPDLFVGLELFYRAFLDLTSCRSSGFGEGPISWLTMHEYSIAHGIEGEQREDLFYHVQQMDAAYLKFQVGKIKGKGGG